MSQLNGKTLQDLKISLPLQISLHQPFAHLSMSMRLLCSDGICQKSCARFALFYRTFAWTSKSWIWFWSPKTGKSKIIHLHSDKLGDKVERILKGSLDLIPSPSPSVKIEIMNGKVCLRCKGKTLLDIVNKLLKRKFCWHHPAMFCLITPSKLSCQ